MISNKLLLLTIVIIISYVYIKIKNRYLKNFFFFILIIILSIPFAFREYFFQGFNTVDSDYYNYKQWFEYISYKTIDLKKLNNIGFNLLIVLSKFIYDNFNLFLLICSIIYNTLMLKFIEKFSINYFFSIILYICFIYFFSYNILRQCLACSIFLYGVKYVFDKKMKKFIFFVIIACLFHISAIGLILLYPYMNNRITANIKNSIIILSTLIIHFYLDKIINLIFKIEIFLNMGYYEKYKGIEKGFETTNYNFFIIFSYLSIVFIIMNYKKLLNTNYMVLSILITCMTLLSTKHMVFSRICNYFIPFMIVFFPITCKIFINNLVKKIYVIFIVILSIYSLIF